MLFRRYVHDGLPVEQKTLIRKSMRAQINETVTEIHKVTQNRLFIVCSDIVNKFVICFTCFQWFIYNGVLNVHYF